MKKALIMLLILSVGFAGGWAASGVYSNGQEKQKESNTPPMTKEAERFVDTSSGEGMAPSEMYTELQKRSGKDFDSQYIAYVILMQNNLTGMNRLAKEKAENTELRDKATEMWQYDSQLTPELYALQKRLGYAHH